MAELIKTKIQSRYEVKSYFIDFSDELPAGVTVLSVEVTHIPPEGGVVTNPVFSIASPVVGVRVGELSGIGSHIVSIIATFSDNQKSEVRLVIPVRW